MNWMDANGTTNYDVYISHEDCPPPDYPDDAYVNVTESELAGLTLVQDAEYCWKVVSRDDQGCFTEGQVWTFETICYDMDPPTVTQADNLSFLAGETEYTFLLTFSEDVHLETSDLTWAAVTGSGTMDSVDEVDLSEYEITFSGASNGDEYTLTVGTTVTDYGCDNPLEEEYVITIFVVNECELSTGTTAYSYLPLYSFYNYSYSQTIYTAAELCGSGNITEIEWDFLGSGSSTDPIVIYMGNTTKTAFASTTDWVATSAMTEVYNGSIVLPAAAAWIGVTLDTPFAYNGTDNLVIAVDRNMGSYYSGPQFRTFTGTTGSSIYHYSDSTNCNPASPTTASSTVANKPNLRFNM